NSGLTFLSAAVSAAYIKVYLLENGICVAKKKTKSVRKSLDPLYNQVLVFSESPQGKVVQEFWTTGKKKKKKKKKKRFSDLRAQGNADMEPESELSTGNVTRLSSQKMRVNEQERAGLTAVGLVIVWGNYGRMDRKCFMGVARILLEELDLSTMVIGWYKLFPTSSMVDPTMAPLIRHSSQMSLESTIGPCCERS
ncbi:Regulating synaptic membrane exocytosis protein 1, partial [Nibea albiflora]